MFSRICTRRRSSRQLIRRRQTTTDARMWAEPDCAHGSTAATATDDDPTAAGAHSTDACATGKFSPTDTTIVTTISTSNAADGSATHVRKCSKFTADSSFGNTLERRTLRTVTSPAVRGTVPTSGQRPTPAATRRATLRRIYDEDAIGIERKFWASTRSSLQRLRRSACTLQSRPTAAGTQRELQACQRICRYDGDTHCTRITFVPSHKAFHASQLLHKMATSMRKRHCRSILQLVQTKCDHQ